MEYGHGPRVLKHALPSRLFHWALILGFLPAAATGLVVHLKAGGEDLVNAAMKIHILGGAVFTASAIFYTLCCFDRVVAFIRRSFSWDDRDVGWFLVLGGYPQKMFLRKKVVVPPMGKVNSGQKILGLCLLFGGPLLALTGWILYAFIPISPKLLVSWAAGIHLYIGLFLSLFLCVHMFLGVYNWGEFKAMFGDGTQPLVEAEEHCGAWVARDVVYQQQSGSQKQISA